mmetsp:Transcript_16239/g.19216  ORF Transcript_16239/g.19216 Transcript_16239/m.19216 type:complete len:412 (+) Transcript_16239:99-1334(+)
MIRGSRSSDARRRNDLLTTVCTFGLKKFGWIFGGFLVWCIMFLIRDDGENLYVLDEPTNPEQSLRLDADESNSWCSRVSDARSNLDPSLSISYPCEGMPHATSAIVCYLTAGVEVGKESKAVFSGRDYVNGALALGASLQKHLTRPDTHRLLLIREGFSIPDDDKSNLEAVGWTIGKAPIVKIEERFTPRFQRYKTTYTKISAIGLSEYKCALLIDADTLAIGSLDDLLSCDILDRPEYHVAGTLDLYHNRWLHFNTGSILWRTSTEEMNRVYKLTSDDTFMKRFESDQIFLNNVYPDRTDKENNLKILDDAEGVTKDSWGVVARLPWGYNAQTHVEVQLQDYWTKNLADVRIIHYTEKKGWQCPETYKPPTAEEMAGKCTKKDHSDPICFCFEGYRWWNFLREAKGKGGS